MNFYAGGGLDRLVLDVKAGSGAFMATEREARQLAESLVAVANGAGLATTALITDMDEPLAPCAGNAIEVAHAALFLRGEERGSRLHEVTLALGAELLIGAGIAAGAAEAREQLTGTIASGAAAERFDRMVRLLGGPADFVANHARHLAAAPIVAPVPYTSGSNAPARAEKSAPTRSRSLSVPLAVSGLPICSSPGGPPRPRLRWRASRSRSWLVLASHGA